MADSGKHHDEGAGSRRNTRGSSRSESSNETSPDGRDDKGNGSLYYRWDPAARLWRAFNKSGSSPTDPAK